MQHKICHLFVNASTLIYINKTNDDDKIITIITTNFNEISEKHT